MHEHPSHMNVSACLLGANDSQLHCHGEDQGNHHEHDVFLECRTHLCPHMADRANPTTQLNIEIASSQNPMTGSRDVPFGQTCSAIMRHGGAGSSGPVFIEMSQRVKTDSSP